MTCFIDDEECAGDVSPCDTIGHPVCLNHFGILAELGERAFREWYSPELDDAQGDQP